VADHVQEAVEAFRKVFWERRGWPISATVVRQCLRAAEPHLRKGWEDSLLSDEAVEAAAKLLFRNEMQRDRALASRHAKWDDQSEDTREEFLSETRDLFRAALSQLGEVER
jgi:hypothetical protein